MDPREIDGKIANILGWKNIRTQLVKLSPEDDSVYPLDEDSDDWDRSRAVETLVGIPPNYATQEIERIPYWSSSWDATELLDWFREHDIGATLYISGKRASVNLLYDRNGTPFEFYKPKEADTPYLAIALAFLKYHRIEK
jgi:hypothetical protein